MGVNSEVICRHLASETTEYIPCYVFLFEKCPKCRVWTHLEGDQSKQWIIAAVKTGPTEMLGYRLHIHRALK
jgi:hypothetical protein